MTEIKLIKNSEVEIAGEIPAGDFMLGKEKAIKELSQTINIKGFRKGKVPDDLMLKNINQQALLERMAVIALEKKYPEIIQENKIEPIGRPEIVITKMAENNPLGFKIKTAVMPEVKLPNYKDIARNAISEKKQEISADEKTKEKEKIRLNILNKVIESMSWEIPEILIEWEKNKMLREMTGSITSMGLKWEDYLKHIKKTEEELKKGWEEDALRRVKYGLALNEMAGKERIEVSNEELNEEIEKITSHPTNTGQNIDKERLKPHVYGVMRNEKLFQLLESLK